MFIIPFNLPGNWGASQDPGYSSEFLICVYGSYESETGWVTLDLCLQLPLEYKEDEEERFSKTDPIFCSKLTISSDLTM